MNRPLCALFAACCAASLAAQGASRNVQLLSRFKPNDAFNDVWGYAAPDGTELAILGGRTGAWIVDCTDPRRPAQRAFVAASRSGWGPSTWRDMRTYRHYLYIVTEGGGGAQIVDLRDPMRPRFVKTFGRGAFSNAHNVAIDVERGHLYACGARQGTPIFDLSADPENPRAIGNYRGAYVHDLHVRDGVMHVAEFNNQLYRIVDARNPARLATIGSTPVSSCHNAWPSRDGRVAVATTEEYGGVMTVVDTTVQRFPRAIAIYRTGVDFTSVHNAYLRDRVAHLAYYSEGYRAVDLSDPRKPVEVGFYDTSSAINGFDGAWGCYPFQPSGNVYISDRRNGLHVLRPRAVALPYGRATAGRGAPRLFARGAAYVGNATFGFDVEGAAPNAAALLVIGARRAAVDLGGVRLNVDVAGAPFVTASATTDARGSATFQLPVPASAGTGTVVAQVLVRDSGAPLGLSATRGVELEVFAR